MFRHWRTVFELLDVDGSKSVSAEEFATIGSLIGFGKFAINRIFDVSLSLLVMCHIFSINEY